MTGTTCGTHCEPVIRPWANLISVTTYFELLIIESVPPLRRDYFGYFGTVDYVPQRPSVKITRELFDPYGPYGGPLTLKMALNSKGRATAAFTLYYRNYLTNALSPALPDDPALSRLSVVAADNALSSGTLAYWLNFRRRDSEILPLRMLPVPVS